MRSIAFPHLIFAAAAYIAAPVAAQTSVVVPNGYESLEGTSAARTPFGWTSGRVQYLVDGAQLCSSAAVVTELQLRLDGGNFNVDVPTAKTFQCRIDAYEVPVTPATMSATWTTNIGAAAPQTLYDGSLIVPAAARILPYPNPWTLAIPLQTPLVYLRANGNLLLDVTVTGGSGDTWPADGFFFHATEARGEVTRIFEDAACAVGGSALALDVPQLAGNGVVGNALNVVHTTPAGASPAPFVYHALGVDNRQTGGVPLPIPLAALGAPGCSLHVDPLLGTLVPAAAGGVAWLLPTTPSAVGVPVFTQAIGIDFATGLLVPSRNAWQVRIGATTPPPGPAQMVHRSNYTTQTTGSLSPTGYYGLVMRFVGAFQ
jgi:hypothetical protein